MGNRSEDSGEDACLSLVDEEEIALLEDDVHIAMDSSYPQVKFSRRVYSSIDENNKQTLIMRMLGRSIGYRALVNRIESFWGLTSEYKIVDLDNNYFLIKLASQNNYDRILIGGPWIVYGHYMMVQPWTRKFSMEETSNKDHCLDKVVGSPLSLLHQRSSASIGLSRKHCH